MQSEGRDIYSHTHACIITSLLLASLKNSSMVSAGFLVVVKNHGTNWKSLAFKNLKLVFCSYFVEKFYWH